MSVAAETYAKLFKLASESRKVQMATKIASIWSVLGHPAVAYTLGAGALGAGLPLAYSIGQKEKQEEIEQARQQGFMAGITTGQALAEATPGQEEALPDENAENSFGFAPGENDVYGSDYPDFGSFGRVGY